MQISNALEVNPIDFVDSIYCILYVGTLNIF